MNQSVQQRRNYWKYINICTLATYNKHLHNEFARLNGKIFTANRHIKNREKNNFCVFFSSQIISNVLNRHVDICWWMLPYAIDESLCMKNHNNKYIADTHYSDRVQTCIHTNTVMSTIYQFGRRRKKNTKPK